MAGVQHQLLDLTVTRLGTTTEIDVAGEIDLDSAPELEAAIDLALEDAPEHLVLDLRAVTFMDSTALSQLIAVAARTQASGIGLVLLRPAGPAARIFALCGVDGLFPEAGARRRHHPAGDGSEEPEFLNEWSF